MPKSRTRKKAKSQGGAKLDWGGPAAKGSGRLNMVLALIAVVAVAGGGFYWWQLFQTSNTFMTLAHDGQAALGRIQTMPNRGGGHLSPGQDHQSRDLQPKPASLHRLLLLLPSAISPPHNTAYCQSAAGSGTATGQKPGSRVSPLGATSVSPAAVSPTEAPDVPILGLPAVLLSDAEPPA